MNLIQKLEQEEIQRLGHPVGEPAVIAREIPQLAQDDEHGHGCDCQDKKHDSRGRGQTGVANCKSLQQRDEDLPASARKVRLSAQPQMDQPYLLR